MGFSYQYGIQINLRRMERFTFAALCWRGADQSREWAGQPEPTDTKIKGGIHAGELSKHRYGIVWCFRSECSEPVPNHHVVVRSAGSSVRRATLGRQNQSCC